MGALDLAESSEDDVQRISKEYVVVVQLGSLTSKRLYQKLDKSMKCCTGWYDKVRYCSRGNGTDRRNITGLMVGPWPARLERRFVEYMSSRRLEASSIQTPEDKVA